MPLKHVQRHFWRCQADLFCGLRGYEQKRKTLFYILTTRISFRTISI